MKDSVLIGTVAIGQPEWDFVQSLVSIRTPGTKAFQVVNGKQGIDEGHNRLNEAFLETDYEWLLSMDSDAVVHPDSLLRLMSWGKPYVSAVATGRIPPFWPVVFNGERENGTFARDVDMMRDWVQRYPELMAVNSASFVLEPRPTDALWPIERGGAHCLLVHRSVIEATGPDWFQRTGSREKHGSGSDFFFTAKVREAGFETFVDRSVFSGHVVHGHVAGMLDFMVWDSVINYESGGIEIPVKER